MGNAAHNISTLEQAHVAEMHDSLSRELHEIHRSDRRQFGDLRDTVLRLVADESYEDAKEELRVYVASRTSYPFFQERADRHVHHCEDLIQALETKRNFPGMASLSLAKQQELYEKAVEHFNELKHSLGHLEKLEREQRLNDVRSTVWVLKSLSFSAAALMAAAFFAELKGGMMGAFLGLIEHYTNSVSIWIVNFFHL